MDVPVSQFSSEGYWVSPVLLLQTIVQWTPSTHVCFRACRSVASAEQWSFSRDTGVFIATRCHLQTMLTAAEILANLSEKCFLNVVSFAFFVTSKVTSYVYGSLGSFLFLFMQNVWSVAAFFSLDLFIFFFPIFERYLYMKEVNPFSMVWMINISPDSPFMLQFGLSCLFV